jgi:hypothetical protein
MTGMYNAPSATTKTVDLESGGSVMLTVTVDVCCLSAADRMFLFDLLDKMAKYQADAQAKLLVSTCDESVTTAPARG